MTVSPSPSALHLDEAIPVLERTPVTLRALLSGLPEAWTTADEGPDTWTAFDVVGHLIHGEHTDWIPRARIILEHGADRAFESFDRFAQFEASRGKTLGQLLDEFETLRRQNLVALKELNLSVDDFAREGLHPELGSVTMGQLLAAWVVHDLGHVAQIARVMAKRYTDSVGAWKAYIPVLAPRR